MSVMASIMKTWSSRTVQPSPEILTFSKLWLDSLNQQDFNGLSDNNKISFNIIKNQLESDIWYTTVFKIQQRDASIYNLSNECYYIINQPYAPLDERLRILSKRLENADKYYQAGLKMLNQPTKESVGLSIMQNQGGLSIFGKDLTDSIKSSHLSSAEISTLNQHVAKTVDCNQWLGGFAQRYSRK